MARLGGRFTGILMVSLKADAIKGLTAALSDISDLQVSVDVPLPAALVNAEEHHLSVDVVGNDYPGIVREIALLLNGQGVSVEELSSHVVAAPMAGGTLFCMTAEICAPLALTPEALRRLIEAAGPDLMVEVIRADR